MSKQNTPDGPSPKIYDTEKIIDIHSSEFDPSFNSKKVRQVNSHLSPSKYTKNSNNKNNLNSTSELSTFAGYSDSNKNKKTNVYDYHGKLK
ncbi:hypothetical protein CDLVIII_3265 [Clostridium sp. DL-VIII]|uniref:hypothetical protein n=1 Tax=Clostridium sp. DL-VIII TaxID=641107 RepID=UPI00023B00FF|nr:hypothetical protein [Clostridium sp. DL-VIII]EHI99838.1 hypothetical protein CDLVIII_3265 [Clostridium sp. DL-VIII]